MKQIRDLMTRRCCETALPSAYWWGRVLDAALYKRANGLAQPSCKMADSG